VLVAPPPLLAQDDAMRLLIVDDEPSASVIAAAAAAGCPGAAVSRVPAGAEPTARLDDGGADVVVLGPGAAEEGTHDTLRALRLRRPELPILLVGTRDAAGPAVAAMKAGASDYVALDGDLARALGGLAGNGRRPARPARPGGAEPLDGLVGRSAAMAQVHALVRTAARTDAHVLIEGETGTGKEVVARALHALGRRAAGPFVPVNCAAVPETLAESEFFGHARGAFTGAVQDRAGVLQTADRGTLFLDEVEDLTPALQAKLLRVVQDREVRPLGGAALRRVDVRIVAASNRDLGRMVEAGEFRRDLYYRLRVFAIQLPALRQRREDIPLLVEHFVARFNRQHGTRFDLPPPAALRPLLEHPWPGNVRELENLLESMLVLAGATGAALGDLLRQGHASGHGLLVDERVRILRVLEEQRWNRQRAAAVLGISRVTLWRRMERHGIRDPLGTPVRETA
jgi:DNA-binding NtrC family response regulator